MLKCRVIPCLLLKEGGLVKTIQFRKETYIGDPINAVKIFNDKEVDELIFLDITATKERRLPNFDLIRSIATECFMPFCYGGGVDTIDTMKNLFKLGVEKVSLNTAAFTKPTLITQGAQIFGSQAIVVSVDVKKDFWGRYKVWTTRGTKNTGQDPLTFAKHVEKLGAGELVIHSIDRDGMMNGYDVELLKTVSDHVNIPVIALGGAGNLSHCKDAITHANVSAVAAGSMFVYHGKTKGILISYLSQSELKTLE